jgi:hypothetical protein
MTNSQASGNQKRWSRPSLDRDHPVRSVGGIYRTSQHGEDGLGGVPLIAAEDAVVAAVRKAYRVAQVQVDRSSRLARRLRAAGDRAAGPHSDRKAVDATEELISRAMMGALTWLEGLSAEGDSPLKRLILTQYRLLGATLGLTPEMAGVFAPSSTGSQAAAPDADKVDASDGTPPASYAPSPSVKVILKGRSRPVRVRHLHISVPAPIGQGPVYFFNSLDIKSEVTLTAMFAIDAGGHATLTFEEQSSPAPPGRWRAAICRAETGEQIGIIEIEM